MARLFSNIEISVCGKPLFMLVYSYYQITPKSGLLMTDAFFSFFSLLPIGVSITLFDIFTAQLNPKSQNNRDAKKIQRTAEARVTRRGAVTQLTPQSCIMSGAEQNLRFFRTFLMLELPIRECGPVLLLSMTENKEGVSLEGFFNSMIFTANLTDVFQYFQTFPDGGVT